MSGSGNGWTICKSAPCSRQITTPAPHHSVLLQAGCPFCRPTNSVKALKAKDKIYKAKRSLYLLVFGKICRSLWVEQSWLLFSVKHKTLTQSISCLLNVYLFCRLVIWLNDWDALWMFYFLTCFRSWIWTLIQSRLCSYFTASWQQSCHVSA